MKECLNDRARDAGTTRGWTTLQQQGDRASEVGFAASGLNKEGIRLEKSGDIRAALAKYRAALDLDPTGSGFRLNYALALCRLARWQDGVVELREVLRVPTMRTPLGLCT